MKKITTFLLLLLIMASAAFAGPIDIEKARERATGFGAKGATAPLCH